MNASANAIEIENLTYAYGKSEAVHGLNLTVRHDRCYGLLGRNGAGKTTTMKCLLGLLRPQRGSVRVFGMETEKQEVAVKSRLAYVPDQISFYPWMTVQETLDYLASFRKRWNRRTEVELIERFRLDPGKRVNALSKGQRTQVALIGAVCPETELLILDEPTSGLDPIVRREFIETVIGAYQEGDPGNRTIFVSTHLITEFEGLIDEFTLMDSGKNVLTLEADQARERYRKIRARFAGNPPDLDLSAAIQVRRAGRDLELIANGGSNELIGRLEQFSPEELSVEALTLEEIFVAALQSSPGQV